MQIVKVVLSFYQFEIRSFKTKHLADVLERRYLSSMFTEKEKSNFNFFVDPLCSQWDQIVSPPPACDVKGQSSIIPKGVGSTLRPACHDFTNLS